MGGGEGGYIEDSGVGILGILWVYWAHSGRGSPETRSPCINGKVRIGLGPLFRGAAVGGGGGGGKRIKVRGTELRGKRGTFLVRRIDIYAYAADCGGKGHMESSCPPSWCAYTSDTCIVGLGWLVSGPDRFNSCRYFFGVE